MSTPLKTAFALSLGAFVSLGVARFSYALMLPSMRADLGWSYFTAGAMNTANAAGYFAGSLLAARWLRRMSARRVLLWTSGAAGVALAAHAAVASDAALYALRFATGVVTAATLIAGALLAARLASAASTVTSSGPPDTRPLHAGLALGIYYGGTGVGIVASAVLVPWLVDAARVHGWQAGWFGLGAAAIVATVVMAIGTRGLDAAPVADGARGDFAIGAVVPALAAYFLFGLGYIGYMTFVVTLLREQHLAAGAITAFYVVLGVAVIASSWVWAGVLQRFRGGQAMTLLDALLAIATLLPVLSSHPVAVFASGLLFGGVFLSLVASTTAFVRHNLHPSAWSAGIAVFTTAFAAGQIVGPALVGAVSDAGGLRGGFALSAAVLALAAVVAWRQQPLARSA